MNSPIILLEKPKYAGNIGMICRLIANFGLEPLRILGEPLEKSYEMEWMAYNSEKEIGSIKYFNNFEEMIKDIDFLVGTTMIHGEDRGRFISLSELANIPNSKKMGLLFGREDKGLSRELSIRCDVLIDFRLPGYQKSMNLSHSVSYVLGVLFNYPRKDLSRKLNQKENMNMKHFYETSAKILRLLEMDNFHGSNFLPIKRLKTIIEKSNLTQGDIAYIYKVFKNIENKILREK